MVIYAIDDPKEAPGSFVRRLVYYVDLVIWSIFVFDLGLRILVIWWIDGVQHAYIAMSIFFDSIILIMGFFSFIGFQQFSFARILRTLKVIVVFAKIQFVEQIVKYLALSIKNIVSLYLYLMLLYLCFAVIFVRFQGGEMVYCDTSNIQSEFIRPDFSKTECLDYGGDWLTFPVNFDNVYNAWKALFVISTGDGWVDMVWRDFDSNNIVHYPKVNSQVQQYLYKNNLFILFIVLFYFFLLDVFTGSIIQEYYKQRNKSKGIDNLTKQQMDWVYLQKMVMESMPKKFIKAKKYCCCISNVMLIKRRKTFEVLKMILYVSHMLVWATADYPMDPGSKKYKVIALCYFSFFIIWSIEFIGLIFTMRTRFIRSIPDVIGVCHYLFSLFILIEILRTHNILEGNVKSITSQQTLNAATSIKQNDNILILFRILLIMRAMTATKYFYNISLFQKIIRIFLYIIPSFISMIVLVLVIVFIFAIIGLNGFTFQSQTGSGINSNANFSTFFDSFKTLFRVLFADNWMVILADMSSGLQPNRICSNFDNNYDNYIKYGMTNCGREHSGFFFLFTFYTTVNFIFFNILIAIVLEAFEILYQQEATLIKRNHISTFIEVWMKFDPEMTSMIHAQDLPALLKELPYPLSLHNSFKTTRNLQYLIARLSIPLYTKKEILLKSSQPLIRKFGQKHSESDRHPRPVR